VIQAAGTVAILDLRIEAAEGSLVARCDLSWSGEALGTFHAKFEELGLADSAASEEYGEPRDLARGAAPAGLVFELASALASHLPAEIPLALRFGQPSGALPMLPWERWLTGALGRPILRHPYLPSRIGEIGDSFEIALCGSVPEAKEEFELSELVTKAVAALRSAGTAVRFHIFVDVAREGELTQRLAGEIEGGQVRVVPARLAEPYGVARRREPTAEEDEQSAVVGCPWLRWMLAESPPRLDLVQFLCHGYLANGRGHLAFAESPLRNRDSKWSRFVGWRELVTFLDRCGARSLVLSSPPGNWSLSGLLALADQVARARPGPAVVHDFPADPGGASLSRTVQLAFAGPGSDGWPFAAAPSISFYPPASALQEGKGHHGRLTAFARSVGRKLHITSGETALEELYEKIDSLHLGEARSNELVERGLEIAAEVHAALPTVANRWEAASQRVLERYTAEVATQGTPDSERGQAMQEGRARALSYVLDLLKTSGPSGTSEK
jgi:hypothetical protein